MKRPIFLAPLLLLLGGCATLNAPVDVVEVRRDATHPATWSGLPLKSGQIILSEAPEATSFAFAMIPDRFYDFTHAGIVAIEDGDAWVYEESGELASIPLHERLLDNVKGKMNRRPLFDYVAPNLFAEIYDPPDGTDGERVAAFARAQFAAKVPFDAYFRWEDHSKLFCTELVELGLRAGGALPHEPSAARFQPSLDLALRWLDVSQKSVMPAGIYQDESRWVASLGQFPSRVNAYAYFAAKRELYRRFHHSDQRLGYLFSMKGTGEIRLRSEIADFVVNASHLFDGVTPPPAPTSPYIISAVRKYADATFGPAPD